MSPVIRTISSLPRFYVRNDVYKLVLAKHVKVLSHCARRTREMTTCDDLLSILTCISVSGDRLDALGLGSR